VHWWNNVLYDTCSLVSLYEVNSVYPGFESQFPFILTIEEVLHGDRLDPMKAAYFRGRVRLVESPHPQFVAEAIGAGNLPKALSRVDSAIYVTALRRKTRVITGDIRLANALDKQGLLAGNMALALRSLVLEGVVSKSDCGNILVNLAGRGEFLLNPNKPQTWKTLEDYRFP